MKRLAIVIAAIIVVLAAGVLLNPLPTPAAVSALDREAGPADTLPEGVAPFPRDGYSSRLLATSDGIRYFVSRKSDSASTCLTIYPDDYPTQWVSGCGDGEDSRQKIVSTGAAGIVTAVLVPDGYDTSELTRGGYQSVHGNVYVVRTPRIPGGQR